MRKQNIIGDRLYNLRMKSNLTISELNKRTDISEGYLSDMENGTKQPSIKMLTTICDFFGITISEFFVDDGMLIDLSEKQRELIRLSDSLNDNQLDNLNEFIKGFYK